MENRMERLIEALDEWLELKINKKRIKKICKKHDLPKFLLDMYFKIQEDIYKKSHIKGETIIKNEKFDNFLYQQLIIGRVYQLNKEFLFSNLKKHLHSSYALTRQITDLYIRSLYIRLKPEYLKIIIGKSDKDKSFPNTKDMIKEIKESSLDLGKFKWTEEATRNKFIDTIYYDFCFFSELFHPTTESFARNIWVVDKINDQKIRSETKLYRGAHHNLKDKSVLFFPLENYIDLESIKRTFHQFFTYSSLILYNLEDDSIKSGFTNKTFK